MPSVNPPDGISNASPIAAPAIAAARTICFFVSPPPLPSAVRTKKITFNDEFWYLCFAFHVQKDLDELLVMTSLDLP